jgi:cation transport regulator ChaC
MEVALLFVAVYLTISQFTRSRASSYIERFNSSDALESRIAVDRWLGDHDTHRARLQALHADPELYTHLRRFGNLFQELGAAYQFRVAHRKTVRVLFDTLVTMYWENLQFWIHDYRAQADPTLYARFEYLYSEIRSRKRSERTRAEYVVAYGSLMDRASASAALGRKVNAADLIPISIVGWKRRWSIGEEVRVGSEQTRRVAVFLDVQQAPGCEESAAMIRVTPGELERLSVREKNYEARDVQSDVRLTGGRKVGPDTSVWCFVGRDEHRVGHTSGEAVLLNEYLRKVVQASRDVDPDIEPSLRDSAVASGFPIVETSYEFVDAKQAALV